MEVIFTKAIRERWGFFVTIESIQVKERPDSDRGNFLITVLNDIAVWQEVERLKQI